MEPVIGDPEEGLVSWVEPDLHAEAVRVSVLEDLREAVLEAARAGLSMQEIGQEVEHAVAHFTKTGH